MSLSSSSSSSSSKRGVSERLTGWLSQTLSSGRRSALIMVAQQQGRMRYLVDQEQRGSEAMWLLGVDHRNEPECFYLDFVSRIWLTYRSHLAHPITTTTTTTTTDDDDHRSRWQWTPHKSWSSDAGWGCMLRTGQSLLANALVHARLSRGLSLRVSPLFIHTHPIPETGADLPVLFPLPTTPPMSRSSPGSLTHPKPLFLSTEWPSQESTLALRSANGSDLVLLLVLSSMSFYP